MEESIRHNKIEKENDGDCGESSYLQFREGEKRRMTGAEDVEALFG